MYRFSAHRLILFFIILIITLAVLCFTKNTDRQQSFSSIIPVFPKIVNNSQNIDNCKIPICPIILSKSNIDIPKIPKPTLKKDVKEPIKESNCYCTIRNLTDNALFVWVNDVRYVLVPEQSVTVAVKKQFVWKIEGRQIQKENIIDKKIISICH